MTTQGPMRAFAAYLMRGRAIAMLVAAIFALLSLVIPPLMQISAAVVALVTLRNSAQYGMTVMLGAALAAGIFAGIALVGTSHGVPIVVAAWATAWVPVWLVANMLRITRSMALAVSGAAAIGIAVVIVMNMIVGDTSAWWRAMLSSVFEPVLSGDAAPVTGEDAEAFLDALAGLMTGIVGAGVVVGTMTSLFIGRWWQAMLYNPGGFRSEFHALRLGQHFGIFSVIVAAVMMLGPQNAARMASDTLMVIIATYMFAGMALAHAAVAAKRASSGWLIAMYGSLFVLPQLVVVLAAAGFTDSWMNLRRHLAADRRPSA